MDTKTPRIACHRRDDSTQALLLIVWLVLTMASGCNRDSVGADSGACVIPCTPGACPGGKMCVEARMITRLLRQPVCLAACRFTQDCPAGYRCVFLRWDYYDNANALDASRFCISDDDPPACTGSAGICDSSGPHCVDDGGIAVSLFTPMSNATCGDEFVRCDRGCAEERGCN